MADTATTQSTPATYTANSNGTLESDPYERRAFAESPFWQADTASRALNTLTHRLTTGGDGLKQNLPILDDLRGRTFTVTISDDGLHATATLDGDTPSIDADLTVQFLLDGEHIGSFHDEATARAFIATGIDENDTPLTDLDITLVPGSPSRLFRYSVTHKDQPNTILASFALSQYASALDDTASNYRLR